MPSSTGATTWGTRPCSSSRLRRSLILRLKGVNTSHRQAAPEENGVANSRRSTGQRRRDGSGCRVRLAHRRLPPFSYHPPPPSSSAALKICFAQSIKLYLYSPTKLLPVIVFLKKKCIADSCAGKQNGGLCTSQPHRSIQRNLKACLIFRETFMMFIVAVS
nr:uncharacterized protein LOC127326910 [Lolium perenne]